MTILTKAEEILLLAILRLKDDAYGTTILREIKRRTGKDLTIGSLWVSLDLLHKRDLIAKRAADEPPARGGRRKIYYTLTPEGIEALQDDRELQKALWRGAGRLLKKPVDVR